MDWTGRRTVITGMNGDDKPQLTGAGDDTFVSDVVNQCLLIVGVEFNTFKAQLLYGIEPVSYTHLDVYKRQVFG